MQHYIKYHILRGKRGFWAEKAPPPFVGGGASAFLLGGLDDEVDELILHQNGLNDRHAVGGQMLIFSFSGSPLSGRSSHSATCTACGYQQRHVDEGSFGRLASPITRIAGQYRDLPKDDALPFEEAINLLQHL